MTVGPNGPGEVAGAELELDAPASTALRRASGLGWTSLVLSAVLVAASIGLADSRQVLDQLRTVDTRWLGVAFAISLVQLALLGLRWSIIATELGLRLRWLKATTEYALSVLANQVLPTGVAGDGLRALRHAKNGEGRLLPAVEALALDRVSGQMALWLVVLVGAPLTLGSGIVDLGSLALGAASIVGGGAAVWLVLARLPRCQPALTRTRRWVQRSARVLLSPRNAVLHLPLSLVLLAFTVLQVYVAARAIGVSLPWLQLAWLGPLILLAASVPSFFGGWGIREGASALLFAAAGMPESTGVAVSMVYGTFALVSSLPGLIVVLFDSKRTSARSRSWPFANALSMIIGTVLGLWLSYPPLIGFVAALCFVILAARANLTSIPRVVLPNVLTALRLLATLALLFGAEHQPALALFTAASFNLLLGAAQTWLSRRSGERKSFADEYDLEAYALLVLALSVVSFNRGLAGPWVLIAGLWRYIVVLFSLCFSMSSAEARRYGQSPFVYGAAAACFGLTLIAPSGAALVLTWLGAASLVLSFLHSLWQSTYSVRAACEGSDS